MRRNVSVVKYLLNVFIRLSKTYSRRELVCEYIKNDGVCHCECQVYHILSSNGTIVEAYNRFARDHSNCDETNIVYNINKWRQGFSGRILNIVD